MAGTLVESNPRSPVSLLFAVRQRRRVRPSLAILEQADRALAGWTCDASTECCRFGVTGREPYLTGAEWQLIADAVRAQGRKLEALRARVSDVGDQRCPLLDDAGRCSVYSVRPLGCRTFLCERARPPAGARAPDKRALNALAQQLADLSGAKGRPLRSWLAGGR
jgi:hypothetical protein